LFAVKQKHKRELEKVGSEYETTLNASKGKLTTIKQKLAVAKEEVLKEKEKWQVKLDSMNDEIEKANDQVYKEKARCRAQVQEQINETARVQMILQNYVDSLEEERGERGPSERINSGY
jgi:hypothetical protein